MKIRQLAIVLFLISSQLFAQSGAKKEVINVHYFENFPFSYKDDKGKLSGIEVDILREYQQWMKKNKGVTIEFNYNAYPDFEQLYASLKSAENNHIGLGTVTVTEARMDEVAFSAPYLNNVSVLVTNGTVPSSYTIDQVGTNLQGMRPVTIKGSTHEMHLKALRAKYWPNSQFEYVNQPSEIPAKIAEGAKYFGYVDIITFWAYIQKGDGYIKMQKPANVNNERFAYILPKGTQWLESLNEFFEGGFGFTATKKYHKILESHLGYEVMGTVELD